MIWFGFWWNIEVWVGKWSFKSGLLWTKFDTKFVKNLCLISIIIPIFALFFCLLIVFFLCCCSREKQNNQKMWIWTYYLANPKVSKNTYFFLLELIFIEQLVPLQSLFMSLFSYFVFRLAWAWWGQTTCWTMSPTAAGSRSSLTLLPLDLAGWALPLQCSTGYTHTYIYVKFTLDSSSPFKKTLDSS